MGYPEPRLYPSPAPTREAGYPKDPYVTSQRVISMEGGRGSQGNKHEESWRRPATMPRVPLHRRRASDNEEPCEQRFARRERECGTEADD